MSLLDTIAAPGDIKGLSYRQLNRLAEEIRHKIITVTSLNGGHIGPNLGVVELTLALHRTFDVPHDLLVMDTTHQGYVHKLLTGRNGTSFDNIRRTQGISGFLSREESPYDTYGAGHAGTALSAALGMAVARDRSDSDAHVIALIGDAALTCGIAMEAFNNIHPCTRRLIVILNDNKWSISKNVGAISQYLNELITAPLYDRVNQNIKTLFRHLPKGEALIRLIGKTKKGAKEFLTDSSSLFETYGLRYLGPIDGHNLKELESYLTFAKKTDRPLLLHVITQKGKGYAQATQNPEKFHGTGAFDIATGQAPKGTSTTPKYQDVFGQALVRLAKKNPKIVAITGAMTSGTGLSRFAKELPRQFFDVGIAEEHAVLFAAGLATQGFRPVCAIYSTFLQRAYDPIIHDVCLQQLSVVFCMDRAGLSPNDGPTHHGLFDIAYLRPIPETTLMSPKDEDELVDMLHTSLQQSGPLFIRYPRGTAIGVPIKPTPITLQIGKAEPLRLGNDIIIWALGPLVYEALQLAETLQKTHGLSIGVVNARFAKPLDTALLLEQAQTAKLIVTLEDGVRNGGFGSAILEALQEHQMDIPLERVGWPDRFIPHGTSATDLRTAHELSPQAIQEKIMHRYDHAVGSSLTIG